MYLVNKTESNLALKQGYIQIPRGQSVRITEEDQKHPDTIYAIHRGFAELVETRPEPTVTAPVQTITSVEPAQGLTEAELLAQKAAKEAEQAPVAEAAPEVAAEPVVEEAPAVKPAKKAAK